MATKYVLRNDVNFMATRLRAGKVVSDAHYKIADLQAAGALLTPFTDTGAPAIASQLQQSSREGQDPTFDVASRVDVVSSSVADSSAITGIPAGGALSGTYPNPGVNVGAGAAVTGTLPLANEGAPTSTGFPHVTAGAWDAAARAVNLATADVTGVLPSANQSFKLASVRIVTTATDAGLSTENWVIYNYSAGIGQETLPAPTAGAEFTITNRSTSQSVTVLPHVAENIWTAAGAAANFSIPPSNSATFRADGTDWNVI